MGGGLGVMGVTGEPRGNGRLAEEPEVESNVSEGNGMWQREVGELRNHPQEWQALVKK